MTQEYEFRSRKVTLNDDRWERPDKVEEVCNEWAKEGFEVFSVIVPDHHNYSTFRLTAKRRIASSSSLTGRKFR